MKSRDSPNSRNPSGGSTGTAPPVLMMAGQKGKELELAAQH